MYKSTNYKPYWIIRDEVAQKLNTVLKQSIKTDHIENGTVSTFNGKIIGYNLSYEEIIAHKHALETELRNSWCEIGVYESCLYNLPYDNYTNIRSIFKEIRSQIFSAKHLNEMNEKYDPDRANFGSRHGLVKSTSCTQYPQLKPIKK